MGNIIVQRLPKTKIRDRKYAYSDLHLDLELEYTQQNQHYSETNVKDVKIDYDLGAIRNSIRNIFLTSPGEKILNPIFGADLRDFLFLPVTETTAKLIKDRIAFNIRVFEPRVSLVSDPKVVPDEDNNQYNVSFSLEVPDLDNSELYFIGILNNDGYITFE